MTGRSAFIISIILFSLTGIICHAQQQDHYDFVPGEKVIFEDDFHSDKIGVFPSHWQMSACADNQYGGKSSGSWITQKEDDDPVLRSSTTFLHISPVLRSGPFPKDSFTVEFDCTFEDAAACAELYLTLSPQDGPCKEVCIHIASWGKISIVYPPNEYRYMTDYPSDFDYRAWHHFAFSYCNKEVKCYIDGHSMLKIPDCDFTPANVSLGCIAPVRFGHFVVTLIDRTSAINDLLTKNKFVTHAIHFPTNKAQIKPESMGIIWELVNFLEKNPSINLRIDGHTDGDGGAASNMALSEARAEEVKRQLIDRGVTESRLTTKGFGSTKPIKPNNSPANKAENRRVEFLRLTTP